VGRKESVRLRKWSIQKWERLGNLENQSTGARRRDDPQGGGWNSALGKHRNRLLNWGTLDEVQREICKNCPFTQQAGKFGQS